MAKSFFTDKAKSWDELSKRLAVINVRSQKEAGTLFEIFAKHFFLTNLRVSSDYKNVWLGRETPLAVKRKLNLEKRDYGYDLVLETRDGKLAVVQCKFTGNEKEKSLSWTKDRLSSFLAASSKADRRIIFTNASSIDSATINKAKERELHTFTYQSLTELSASEIAKVYASIIGKKIATKRLRPYPHQKKAIKAVLKGFRSDTRGKLILPCGAGKTLTSLWIKEAQAARRTLVLVPSLQLLRQFKNDWKRNERRPIPYLCVCSEKDIDSNSDSVEVNLHELGTQVTTSPQEIREFVGTHRECIIYSTYQSSPCIARAIKGTKINFDLAICDEAHRTAGSMGSNFSTVHDEKKIRVAKRLYMTATPRVVSKIAQDRLGHDVAKYLCDMNDERVYGKELFRMTFKEAIKAKVLVDYKIVAVGITDADLRRAVKERKHASANTTVEDIANHLALEKVSKRYHASHTVTFHSSVQRAKDFYELHSSIFPKVTSFHVNGGQPTDDRAHTLDEFKRSKKALVTNARCLTEGIDVPKIDSVYFCDPRYSVIDIVQASGRALRLDRDRSKKVGLIIVPVFHQEQRKLEKEIERGVFKNLVRVVRAMADQDARLEDEIQKVTYGDGLRHSVSPHSALAREATKLITLEGFEKKLSRAIFAQVITKSVVPWRPFAQARKFVHSLGLKNITEWRRYCKGQLKGKKEKPDDIPATPNTIYRKEFQGTGDWLGTGIFSRRFQHARSFEEARMFVRRLKLKSVNEWQQYCKGQLKGKQKKPGDIPVAPDGIYKDEFQSWGDWLGTGRIATQLRHYRSFEASRKFVHRLELKNINEWDKYCRGQLKGQKHKPDDIPAKPNKVFKKEFKGMGDWLGTATFSSHYHERRSFKDARTFVQKLKLKSVNEWKQYCRGQLKTKNYKPADIPVHPNRVYKKEWKSFGDWLGTGRIADNLRQYRNFHAAREFARALKFKSGDEWRLYCNGKMKGQPKCPEDIPAYPEQTYSKHWIGMGDWLGTGFVAFTKRKYRSFFRARSFVRALGLKKEDDWRAYCKGQLPGLPAKPSDISASPAKTYAKYWKGMANWLGTEGTTLSRREFRPFTQARLFAQKLKLKSGKEWFDFCRGILKKKWSLPRDIPRHPKLEYGSQWKGMGDWLGTGTVANRNRKFRSFNAARAYVRKLGLRTQAEWNSYCQGNLSGVTAKPLDIPQKPSRTYLKQWRGIGDWLGTGTIATFDRKYLSFSKARKFARGLKLSNVEKWNKYCRGVLAGMKSKPDYIPQSPQRIYKVEWKSWGDWLGTGRISNIGRVYRSFFQARAFVRSLKLKSLAEWRLYCKGAILKSKPLPLDIPKHPHQIYADNWLSFGDWFGTGTVAPFLIQYRSFRKAREFVRTLKFKSGSEWRKYCQGTLSGFSSKPTDIPAYPNETYSTQWKSMGDWLGTGSIAPSMRVFRPFKQARKFARSLGLESRSAWLQFCRGKLKRKGKLPIDIPTKPERTYKSEWRGMGDWLGA